MYLSEFLSRHLEYNFPVTYGNTICKMCGKIIFEGVKQADIINKQTFNDYQYLKYDSKFLCVHCSATIGQIAVDGKEKTRLRSFSFIATENDFLILKREQLWNYIFNPPEDRFVFCVTYSHKKHIAFKSQIQYSNKLYKIFTDKGEVELDLYYLEDLAEIIQNWYTVLPDKVESKQQPTWFTKGEILSGARNIKNITRYGIQKYYSENLFLGKYRNTTLLTLLVFAVNKKLSKTLIIK